MNNSPEKSSNDSTAPWYAEVTRYQWMVLIIACAGWVFDVYEGQIFNITRSELLKDFLKDDTKATIRCIPQDGDLKPGKCMVTGNPSAQRVIFAKAY